MRFLTNENIPSSAVALLRQAGHDVLAVKESMRGAADPAVLDRAVAEGRVLVTFDKDFGELAFRSRLPASCGVVLFRITPRGRDQDTQQVVQTLLSRTDWAGAFWTVMDKRLRLLTELRRINQESRPLDCIFRSVFYILRSAFSIQRSASPATLLPHSSQISSG